MQTFGTFLQKLVKLKKRLETLYSTNFSKLAEKKEVVKWSRKYFYDVYEIENLD